MTEWTIYKCEICGKEFEDDEEACLRCEESHLLNEYKGAIHLYDRHKRPLDITACDPDDAYYVFCDDSDAAEAYATWADSHGCSHPYGQLHQFEPGLFFYDGDNEWGIGDWTHMPTLLEKLTDLMEYFQQ